MKIVFAIDPLRDLCDKNHNLIKAYPDSFLGIDFEKGIMAHGKTQEEFKASMANLSMETIRQLNMMYTGNHI